VIQNLTLIGGRSGKFAGRASSTTITSVKQKLWEVIPDTFLTNWESKTWAISRVPTKIITQP